MTTAVDKGWANSGCLAALCVYGLAISSVEQRDDSYSLRQVAPSGQDS